jgi:hypothetical protein
VKTVASDLLAVLGKKASDPEVVRAVAEHALDHVYDDPPLRRYVGSQEQGAALLFNKDRVVDVQIYVQPTKLYHALAGPLPFGLQKGMTRQQVHELLGSPEIDDFDSQYLVRDRNLCLTVVYHKTGVVRYLSVALLNGGN